MAQAGRQETRSRPFRPQRRSFSGRTQWVSVWRWTEGQGEGQVLPRAPALPWASAPAGSSPHACLSFGCHPRTRAESPRATCPLTPSVHKSAIFFCSTHRFTPSGEKRPIPGIITLARGCLGHDHSQLRTKVHVFRPTTLHALLIPRNTQNRGSRGVGGAAKEAHVCPRSHRKHPGTVWGAP